MTQHTHYEIEDIPPNDADTQVALYEQASEVITGHLADAHVIFTKLETSLHQMFVEAENAGDGEMMTLINDSWERIQRMAAMIGQQGSALTGANKAIDALKIQRDAVLSDLNSLLTAIDKRDADHPQLIDLIDEIRELEQDYYYDEAYGMYADETADCFRVFIEPLLPEGYSKSSAVVTHELIRVFEGFKEPTSDQKDAIINLLLTFDHPQGGES